MLKNLLRRIAGKSDSTATAETPPPSASAPEATITVYDAYGRELTVTRAHWLESVLRPGLEKAWNRPDELYGLVVNALNDGFLDEVDEATAQLQRTDPDIERGHVIRAIVLLEHGRLDESGRVLALAASRVGETAAILTNLAKVQAARGDHELARTTLWRAIERDPNFDNAVMWWAALAQEREGAQGSRRALEHVAALPGSVRAQVWLARESLNAGDTSAARAYYEQVLHSGRLQGDTLVTMSGDLGNAGEVALLLELVGPVYDPAQHDPRAGMNLVVACLEAGRLDEGERFLDALYRANLPPYRQHLDQLAQRYQQARAAEHGDRPIEPEQMQIVHVPFDRPVWMFGLRDPAWLFHPKPPGVRRVTVLAFDKVVGTQAASVSQREDDIGRLSRAIPLYIAEALHEWTDAQATTVMPVVQGGGPVVFGAADNDEAMLEPFAQGADVLILGTLSAVDDDVLRVRVRVWDLATRTQLAEEIVEAAIDRIHEPVTDLARDLLRYAGRVHAQPYDPLYAQPQPDSMPAYLNGLAQGLMLSLVGNGLVPKDGMWGERSMLEWPLRMGLQWPGIGQALPMYLAALSNARRYGSQALGEFEQRTMQFLGDVAAHSPDAARLRPLAFHAFGRTTEFEQCVQAASRDTSADADDYRAWLARIAQG